MKNYFLCGLLFLAMTSCVVKKTIIEKPIVFDAEREQLTLEYMKDRYGLEATTSKITPKMIVLHWTVIPTLKGSYDAFYSAKLPNWRPDLENVSGLNVSSQFLIDQDGTIYQLMPENQMARHVIGLNHCAIGVENVGGGTDLPLSRKQLKSNIWLIKYLKDKYDIDYVIGHYEYTNFEGHELWLEKDAGYRTVKTDPGERFMKKVRKATKKLEFKPVPEN
ncbi:peptidoglycan recognition family protein [Cellulophaga sp. HaHa_2_1]|uniref:peptidoglycan recognition protein family protein n=1 Tax=Cellulophaga sp. HaHa_2_1 TaxID=2749994 RepID=UPI001C501707|nr:peptidoglycan recognition family protein [Cellulophaga sp. HaHa_2_1]QXP53301.1 N-acetylmuramoyl-L-alanine amidase [Cellulophaga sp. HaHa_2_1]